MVCAWFSLCLIIGYCFLGRLQRKGEAKGLRKILGNSRRKQ